MSASDACSGVLLLLSMLFIVFVSDMQRRLSLQYYVTGPVQAPGLKE